jgi:cell division protein ZapA (FtsZ GTPase activity inhibitor)
MKPVVRKVSVNGRPYEITVESEHEEMVLNESVKLVNKKIEEFSSQITGRDKNDMLAMAALEIAANYLSKEKEYRFLTNEFGDRLQQIDEMLEASLENKA